jgi:hypothetical protein
MQTFEFRKALAGDRGAYPKAFFNALAASGRFFRNRRGQILFLASRNPDEFVAVQRREELRAILESAEVVRLTGDPLDNDDFAGMWFWLHDRRMFLPAASKLRHGDSLLDSADRP